MPTPTPGRRRRRVLFVAEAVTLAHVARPLVLAGALDPGQYEIVFAADSRYRRFYPADRGWVFKDIFSIPSDQFLRALARAKPVYTTDTLSRYVEDDLALIDEVDPDVVVGDFRLSLSVSARVRKRPYLTITNAYWSPFAERRLPLPVLPMNRLLGVRLAGWLFRLGSPLGFMYHAVPLNRVRRRYGLPSLGLDLRRVYTDADVTAYADIPELIPTADLPSNHHYLGPVVWSPPVARPAWWEELPAGRPAVYVTLGSSGHQHNFEATLEALAPLECTVIAATAGLRVGKGPSRNALVADYLPGEEAARRSKLVICNGGSPTSHQALAVGTPVLGIATNMDQFLNMESIARFGAGRLLRGDRADPSSIRDAVRDLLSGPQYARSAKALSDIFAKYSATTRLAQLVGDCVSSSV